MPIHSQTSASDPIFAHDLEETQLPKYHFPETTNNPSVVKDVIASTMALNSNQTLNLATFCQTWVEKEVVDIMKMGETINLIDKDEYPAAAELENRCVSMVANLWNVPDEADTIGCSTSGSSEACMIGALAALRRWKKKRQAQGLPTDKPNLVSGATQVCWHKFCRYWEVEQREVPMRPGKGGTMISPELLKDYVDENTILVVATLGLTFTLEYEPIQELANELDRMCKESNGKLDVDIHVDGASGGFLAPFLNPDLVWDFRVPRVKSISASGHKFGLAPLGVGWVVWKHRADLPDELVMHVNYLGGDMAVFALNFSRPAGAVIASYYNFVRLGREGYTKIHQVSKSVGMYLADAIAKLDKDGEEGSDKVFEMIYDGSDGIPGCCWKMVDGKEKELGWGLFDLADKLRSRGWLVPAYTLPSKLDNIPVQRILCRQGFSRELATQLIADMKGMVKQLSAHPQTVLLSEKEAGGFKHS